MLYSNFHDCNIIGNVYVEFGPRASHTLQHGAYMRIHLRVNNVLFIQKSAYKATCCLLSKRDCFVKYPQIGGKSNQTLKNEGFERK